jgi:hypothetical protein
MNIAFQLSTTVDDVGIFPDITALCRWRGAARWTACRDAEFRADRLFSGAELLAVNSSMLQAPPAAGD